MFGPVTADLQRLELMLEDTVLADPVLAGRAMIDLMAAGGKRLRPALLLLSATLGSYEFERVAPAALAIELLHTATLVHDDVIDHAETRRGRPTVATSHGPGAAIVIADYYFAKAYGEASRTGTSEVVAQLARAVMRVCHGELQQQQTRLRYRITVERYMRRIQLKTAALTAAACSIGGLLGGLDAAEKARLTRFGSRLGTAFQMADDVLDYTAAEADMGKPAGQDLLEGHATLPLLLAYDLPGGEELKSLLPDGRAADPTSAARVVELVRASGAPQAALDRARQTAVEAVWELAGFAGSPASRALAGLADYVVSRNA